MSIDFFTDYPYSNVISNNTSRDLLTSGDPGGKDVEDQLLAFEFARIDCTFSGEKTLLKS
jgi:hypothetical protein